jgi:hypothetical protein
MKAEEFKKLRELIAEKKEKRSRAFGVIEQLEAQLKKELSIDSIDKVESVLSEIEKDIETDTIQYNGLMAELDALTDWARV